MFLVALDFEGVLVKGEYLLELAKMVGKCDVVEELTRGGVEGRLKWKETLHKRIALLKGVEYKNCLEATKALKLYPGAREFVDALRKLGNVKVGIVTGCFDIVVNPVKEELGLDFAVANKLVFKDGRLAGVDLVVDANKDIHVECLAKRYGVKMENVIAIGDGANDASMISKAGLGIAFNPAPILTKYAEVTLKAERLDEALPIIKEFISKRQAVENSSEKRLAPKILICDPIDEEGIELFQKFGFEVVNKPGITFEDLKKEVADCDVLIVRSRTKVTKEIIDFGKNLKVIARAGAGIDNIDVEYAEKKGIKVICASDAVANSVAELTVGLMLSLARQIPRADHEMKNGKWAKNELEGWELRGKTLGIIGFGRIGQRVAQLAKAFGMKILIYDLNKPAENSLKELNAQLVSLDELLNKSDIITLHVPLTNQTYHMIGRNEIGKMKDGVYVVNTSRGSVIDEKALFDALKTGKIAGAALDVYEKEPPNDRSIVELKNVVCTPHIGAQTLEAQKDTSVDIATKIIQLFKHRPEDLCEKPCQECIKL
ncbi:MAG: phosphoserine phosphatase SerB [Nitrososphaerota archaeon]|nr:phosphoserine phosphatase SerB [Candidatus Bathyarchaeota archaeon]MDW8023527.1 phosphoserine phosphatase SerB [Nitrososphaerota archaeon]